MNCVEVWLKLRLERLEVRKMYSLAYKFSENCEESLQFLLLHEHILMEVWIVLLWWNNYQSIWKIWSNIIMIFMWKLLFTFCFLTSHLWCIVSRETTLNQFGFIIILFINDLTRLQSPFLLQVRFIP